MKCSEVFLLGSHFNHIRVVVGKGDTGSDLFLKDVQLSYIFRGFIFIFSSLSCTILYQISVFSFSVK